MNLCGIEARVEGEPAGPPTEADLRELLAYAGGDLPADYLEVIQRHDGLMASFGRDDEGYIVFDSCRDTIETNRAHGLGDGAPLLVVGGDGAGKAYAIERASKRWVQTHWDDLPDASHATFFEDLRALLGHILSEADDIA